MQKASRGLLRVLRLKNKYLSLVIVSALISFSSYAQYDSTKVLQAIQAYGYSWKNAAFLNSFKLPNDTPHLALANSGSLAYKGGSVWVWTGIYWLEITGGGGGGDNTINLTTSGTSGASTWDAGTRTLNVPQYGEYPGMASLYGDGIATGPGAAELIIQPNVISNQKLAQMPPYTFKGNNTASTDDPQDLPLDTMKKVLKDTLYFEDPLYWDAADSTAKFRKAWSDSLYDGGTTYVPGSNVAITGNVISASDSTTFFDLDTATVLGVTNFIFRRRNGVFDTISVIPSSTRNIDSIRRVVLDWQYLRGGSWITYGTDSIGSGGTAANPTASVGLSAVNGVASTYLRSDGAPPLSQTIAPTWSGLHTFRNSLTASGGFARSTIVDPTLTANANGNVLSALYIAPTFTLGAFTGTESYALNAQGGIYAGGTITLLTGSSLRGTGTGTSTNIYIDGNNGLQGNINFRATAVLQPATTMSGNFTLNAVMTSTASNNTPLFTGSGATSLRIANTTNAQTWYLDVNRNNTRDLSLFKASTGTPLITFSEKDNVGIGVVVPNQAAVLELVSTSKAFLPPRMTTAQRNAIVVTGVTAGTVVGGTGYTTGTFYNTSFTGGTGTGATGTMTVAGGAVQSTVTIVTSGSGYVVGDVLSASLAGGSGFTYTVTSLTGTEGGLTIYCTDCTATDASTGVMQTRNAAGTWKNNW